MQIELFHIAKINKKNIKQHHQVIIKGSLMYL